MDHLEPCLQLATDIVAKLQRGSEYVRQNDMRALSCCLTLLNEYAESIVRIIWNLPATELRRLLIELYFHLLKFLITNETRVQSEEGDDVQLPSNPCIVAPQTGRGRPSLIINMDDVRNYRKAGLSLTEIAGIMGISRKTLYRTCKKEQPLLTISDPELQRIIEELKDEDPYCGEPYISGELRVKGLRVPRSRVRKQLRIVDPVGTVRRLRRTTKRGKYKNKGPNFVWHMDGNENLQAYGIYIHGAVDAYSRKVMYLRVASSKKSRVVARFFKASVRQFGLPKRVRSDKGRENMEVARIMLQHRGPMRGSFITGRSVHNVRIERFWREVNRITKRFKNLFQTLEELNLLNLDNDEQMFYLHYLFLPQIQKFLSRFQFRWDAHKIRTAKYRTPNHLYMCTPRAPTVACDLENSTSQEPLSSSPEPPNNEQIWRETATRLFPNPLAFDEYTAVQNFKLLSSH